MNSDGKIGVAMLSFAHVHARGYADQVKSISDCEMVAIWDEDSERGRKQAEDRGVPFYETLESVLELSTVDAVVCNAPTSMHKEVLIAAAKAGKHIFTEKSLTITLSDATDVLREVEVSGVKFMISFPSRVRPEILFAKQVLDQGLLGDVTLMRTRIAHSAALDKWFSGGTLWFGDEDQAGGGAFFDLGCHRVDVMRWFLGEPESATAQLNNFSNNYSIDDNMVALIKFRNKALGIIDVSWVHRHGPNPLEIYGTEGYLGIEAAPNGPRIQLISDRLKSGDIQGYVLPTSLPAALPTLMDQWVASIKNGTSCSVSIYDGWNLVQLMEGCYNAGRQGHEFIF